MNLIYCKHYRKKDYYYVSNKKKFLCQIQIRISDWTAQRRKRLKYNRNRNNIQPNLLRNWKKEFLDKASVVFNDTREDNLKEKLALERKEKAEYAKKVGQLTMQVDWLKKKSEETLGPDYESKFSPKPFED